MSKDKIDLVRSATKFVGYEKDFTSWEVMPAQLQDIIAISKAFLSLSKPKSKWSRGAEWLCVRDDGMPDFKFIIITPVETPHTYLCRGEIKKDGKWCNPWEQEYTAAHIEKHCVYQPEV